MFPAPRYDVRARARGRLLLRAYAGAVFLGGLLPQVIGLETLAGAAVWVALVLGGVGVMLASRADRSPSVALVGLLPLCWPLPSIGMAAFGQLQAVAMGLAGLGFWPFAGRAGMPPPRPEPSLWRPAT